MRKRQRRLCFLLIRELCKLRNNIHQLLPDDLQSLIHGDDIRVIAHIAACSAQMDNTLCLRALHAVSVYMRHHIVPYFFFSGSRHVIVNIIYVGF